jgi:hypothetical protein
MVRTQMKVAPRLGVESVLKLSLLDDANLMMEEEELAGESGMIFSGALAATDNKNLVVSLSDRVHHAGFLRVEPPPRVPKQSAVRQLEYPPTRQPQRRG